MPTLDVAIESRQAESAAKRLQREIRDLTRSNRELAGSIQRLDTNLRTGAANTDRYAASAGRARRATRQLSGDMTRLVGLFGGFAAARGAVTTIRDFEQSLAILNAVAVRTTSSLAVQQQQMEALARTAREVGATTRFSATEAADGLLNLARAGLDANQAIAAIRPTLNLAQVGLLEVGEAGDVVTNVMSQFSLAATDLTRVTDALVNTSNNANTTVQQLAQALIYVGPVAAKAGLSLEQTTALLGTLADNGIKGTLAGTQLRQVILTLQDPSNEAAAAFARMGKNVDDLRPSSQSLIQTFKELGAANLDLSRASEVFETRSVAAALQLATNTQKTDELIEAQQRLQGRSEEIARTMDDTLAGAFKSLTSSIEEVILGTGDRGLTGILKDTTKFLTDGVRSLTDFGDSMDDAAGGARNLALALGGAGLGLALAGLLTFVGPAGLLVAGFSGLAAITAGWANSLLTAGNAVTKLRGDIQRLNDTLSATRSSILDSPVGSLAEREALQSLQLQLASRSDDLESRLRRGQNTVSAAILPRTVQNRLGVQAGDTADTLKALRALNEELFSLNAALRENFRARGETPGATPPGRGRLIDNFGRRVGGFSGLSGPPAPPDFGGSGAAAQGPDLNGQLRDAAVFAEYARQVDELARSAANAKEIEEGRNRAIQDSIYALERQTEQVARSLARPIVDGIYAGLRDENPGEAILRGLTDAAVGNAGQIVENVLTQQLAKVGLVQQTAAVQLSTSVVSSAATFSGTVVSAGLAFAAAVSGGGSPSYLSTAARGILAGGGAGASTTGGSAVGGEFVVTRPTQLVQNGRAVGEIGEEGPESVSVTPGTRGSRFAGRVTINNNFSSRVDATMRLTRDQLAGNDRRRLIRNSDR